MWIFLYLEFFISMFILLKSKFVLRYMPCGNHTHNKQGCLLSVDSSVHKHLPTEIVNMEQANLWGFIHSRTTDQILEGVVFCPVIEELEKKNARLWAQHIKHSQKRWMRILVLSPSFFTRNFSKISHTD